MATIKLFKCITCQQDREVITDRESNPLFMCAACLVKDKSRNTLIIPVDGAPRGRVRGSDNPVRQ